MTDADAASTGSDLAVVGWDEEWARLAAASSPGTPGRVLHVDRGLAAVLTAHGVVRVGFGGGLFASIAADPVAVPTTGDWVLLRDWPDDRLTLEHVLARRTSVVRAGAGRRTEDQVLASNVSVAAVVVAAVPDPGLAKVERLLSLAWASGARPLLVLSKSDLAPDATDLVAELAAGAPGVETFAASAVTDDGIDRLRQSVRPTGTLALLGSSGVGKSSLVNAMVGAQVLRTRQIRDDGRGRHTSVRRELVQLPGGGCVIDTPGLRGVGLAGSDSGVTRVFADVDELARACRFADCTHDGGPGCAVAAAVDSAALPLRRLEAWRRLQRELAWTARRREVRKRATTSRNRSRARAAGTPSRRKPWLDDLTDR